MKTVINLIKELGVKSTAEVLELLRQVGVDTEADGFGVMSKITEDTIAKVHANKSGQQATVTKPKSSAPRKAEDTPKKLDLKKTGITGGSGKDFFGTRKVSTSANKSVPQKSGKKPLQGEGAKKTTLPSQTRTATANGRMQKPDLSKGPRIISMPDPGEATRLKRKRETSKPAASVGRGPGQALQPEPSSGRPAKGKKQTKADYGAGRRRKLKNIGVVEEEGRVRSRKRVFKIAGKSTESIQTVIPHLRIAGEMTVREIAKATGVKTSQIFRFLMTDLGIMAGINHLASVEEIQLIADNFEIKHTLSLEAAPEVELEQFELSPSNKLVERPPIVTVMGHVDHGKTKLLDCIRATKVAEEEAGGITQHIGAYQVEKKGKHITFLDTPGHAAFTAMRARGSQITDVVILVVAADDGVMPQTVEAIEHAKSAQVPIIVAVNKIDKESANPERVKQQLSEYGLVAEEWGGDTVFVNVSALKGDGIDDLLDMVLLTSELSLPTADPTAPPFGVVVESEVDTGVGVVATVLVKQGTMRRGMFILSGAAIGRIKRMENDAGVEVDSAPPAMPIKIIGFSEPPENGDKVYCFKNKKQAQAIADLRKAEKRLKATSGSSRMSLEAFFKKTEAGKVKHLNVIVKADVLGSAEAVSDALNQLEVEGAKCTVISSGVGQINETDVNLAAASNAVIIGFTVGIPSQIKQLVEKEGVDCRLYDIIYKVTEDVEAAMKGLLDPVFEEHELGRAEIRAIFKTNKEGSVVGGYVLDGVARRGAKYRLRRGTQVLFDDGTLGSLRRFKDDTKEVASGFECGFMINPTNVVVEEGDIIEFFEMVELERS